MKRFTILSCICLATIGSWQAAGAQQLATRATSTPKIESDREQDGLIGPVRRVRFETAKIFIKAGSQVEGARAVSQITTYDINGRKIDTVAYPVENSAPAGREQYVYDDKGNISEMVVRGLDGSILSKEIYTYDFDQLGNWKKMNASVAVFEDGKLSFEPVEVTYRTITYYYGQAVDKAASASPSKSNATAVNSVPLAGPLTVPAVPASGEITSANKGDISVAPLVIVGGVDANKQAHSSEPSPVNKEVPTVAPVSSETHPAALVGAVTPPGVTAEPSSPNTLPNGSKDPSKSVPVSPPPAAMPVSTTEGTHVSGDLGASSMQVPTVAALAVPANQNAKPETLAGGAALTNTKTGIPSTSIGSAKPVDSTTTSAAVVNYYKQGLAYLQKGRYTEALGALHQAVAQAPNDALAYMSLGLAYSATLQYKDAANAFRQAIRLNPQVIDAEAYYRLGEAYSALEKNSEAVNAFKQALYITRNQKVEPDPAKYNGFPTPEEAHYGLGLAYFNQSSYKDALKEFKQAVELKPGFDEAHYGIALAHIGLSDLKSAGIEEKILRPLNGALADKVAATINRSVILPPGVARGGTSQRQ